MQKQTPTKQREIEQIGRNESEVPGSIQHKSSVTGYAQNKYSESGRKPPAVIQAFGTLCGFGCCRSRKWCARSRELCACASGEFAEQKQHEWHQYNQRCTDHY